MAEYNEALEAVPFDPKVPGSDWGAGAFMFMQLAGAGSDAPAYYSAARDSWLREFWRGIDPLKVAVNTFVSKANTIPVTIRPRDRLVKRHAAQAERFQADLMRNSQLLKGWKVFFKKFLIDYLTTDNGAFAVVMGKGPADGPILGAPMGLYHLDSMRCVRTGDAEYPVRYMNVDGKYYKLHYTRVIMVSALPAPDAELYDVGFCPVSYAIDAAAELRDIYTYSKEKFGSRPQRQVLYVKKGATMDQLAGAIHVADEKLNSDGLTRFAKTLLLAPKIATQELELATLDLSSAPDNFDRMDVTLLDMAMIAASFGLDLRDVAIAFGVAGQTKSDAEVQDRKGRGKGVGEFLEALTDQLNFKYLPPQLELSFDNLDDAQDEQQATIRNTRSQARERDLRSGVTTIRVERELMLRYNEITVEEFEEMELLDGRLPNGLDVLLLFSTTDARISDWLDLGVDDPTLVEENDPQEMLDEIHERIIEVSQEIDTATRADVARQARQSLAALEKLQALYRGQIEMQQQEEMQAEVDAANPDPNADMPGGAEQIGEETVDGQTAELPTAGDGQPSGQATGGAASDAEKATAFVPNGAGQALPLAPVAFQGSAEAKRGAKAFDRLVPQHRQALTRRRPNRRATAKHRGQSA